VRQAAQRALAEAALSGLDRAQSVDYDLRIRLAGLPEFRSRIVSVDPGRAELFEAREAELAQAFQRLGEAGERRGERCFLQPMRADVFRPTASPRLGR
jgi:hypothetical protein